MKASSALMQQFDKDADKYGTEAVEALGVFLFHALNSSDQASSCEKLNRFFEKLHTYKGLLLMLPDTRELGERLHVLEARLATQSTPESVKSSAQWGSGALHDLQKIINQVSGPQQETANQQQPSSSKFQVVSQATWSSRSQQTTAHFEFRLSAKNKKLYLESKNVISIIPIQKALIANWADKTTKKKKQFLLFRSTWIEVQLAKKSDIVVIYQEAQGVMAVSCVGVGKYLEPKKV